MSTTDLVGAVELYLVHSRSTRRCGHAAATTEDHPHVALELDQRIFQAELLDFVHRH